MWTNKRFTNTECRFKQMKKQIFKLFLDKFSKKKKIFLKEFPTFYFTVTVFILAAFGFPIENFSKLCSSTTFRFIGFLTQKTQNLLTLIFLLF